MELIEYLLESKYKNRKKVDCSKFSIADINEQSTFNNYIMALDQMEVLYLPQFVKLGYQRNSQDFCLTNQALSSCKSLVKVVIPNSVREIGSCAFYGCVNLQTIILPDYLEVIGPCAFVKCESLKTISIPDSVESISEKAFVDCHSLVDVRLPKQLKSIRDYTFCNCTNLQSIIIPDSVLSIHRNSFSGCKNLRTINIPEGVSNIHYEAFEGCSSLPVVDGCHYAGSCLVEIIDKEVQSYTIKPDTKFIGSCAFKDCKNLETIILPESIISIGINAFFCCKKLISINLPESINYIGLNAFWSCDKLPMNNDCIIIGSYLIKACNTSLKEYSIPNGIRYICDEAFKFCHKLESISIPESVEYIGFDAFSGCDKLPVIDGCLYADTYLVKCIDRNIEYPTIKKGTRFIGDSAFKDCRSITYVTIPNGVSQIGSYSFSGCAKLQSLIIPESVKFIGDRAFDLCTKLNCVDMPSNKISLGVELFVNCKSLHYISISKDVYYDFYYDCNIPPIHSIKVVHGERFETIIDADKVTEKGEFIIKSGKICILSNVVGDHSKLKNIVLKSFLLGINKAKIVAVNPGIFEGCTSLEKFDCSKIKYIGNDTFKGCENLREITNTKHIEYVGSHAFEGCKSLKQIKLSNPDVIIEDTAFSHCDAKVKLAK